MPNRIIKDSINDSRKLSECTIFAQDLFKRLITYADDNGRFNADTQIMCARLYPREMDIISQDDIIAALIELSGLGKIGFYTSTARKEVYGAFPNWANHQRIRDSKKKCPDPDDTDINDWYLRRFVPINMKIALLEASKGHCAICNKAIFDKELNVKKLLKMNLGLFHIDHIVPCSQGGRASYENLQITCPKCNLIRKRLFTYDEILQFAANGGDLPPNPIQSESKTNPKRIQSVVMHGAETAPCAANDEKVSSFLLNDGSEYEIFQSYVTKFKDLYPAVNIEQELKNITGWCLSNPKKRKTRSGAMRFLNSWLADKQNKGVTSNAGGSEKPKVSYGKIY